jgi:hypothetical protein
LYYVSPMCYSWLMFDLDFKPSRCDALKLRANFSPVAHLPMRRPRDYFWDATGWLASIGEQIKRLSPLFRVSDIHAVVGLWRNKRGPNGRPSAFRSPSTKAYLINIPVGWLSRGCYIAILVGVCGCFESDWVTVL